VSASSLITDCKIQAEQKIALAIFPHEKTSSPTMQCEVSWEKICKFLKARAVRESKSGKGFVAAKLNGTRANRNVEYCSLGVLDSDQGVPFDEGLKRLKGFNAVLYTTHSHSKEHPKWRAVVELELPVTGGNFPAFRAGFVEKFGEDISDSQCNDAARFYYFPSCPADKKHLSRTEILEGVPLDPDSLIERGGQILEQRRRPVTINHDLDSGVNLPMEETIQNIEIVKGMLAVLDAACDREKWRNIGWALASLGWRCGYELFDEWSKTALKARARNEH
jgi:hypothetical protein